MSGLLSSSGATAGRFAFELAYQASPVILSGGLAQNIPGQLLPIVALTEGVSIVNGLLAGSLPTALDDFFAQFVPLPGATLISQQFGLYPLANQYVAANALIVEPLAISLRMIVPARGAGGYVSKLATVTLLTGLLQQHSLSGGTFTIVTPSYIYDNCLLLSLLDDSSGETRQPQVTWRLDFIRPVISQAGAVQAYNGLMSKLSNALPVSGNPPSSSLGALGTQSAILGQNVAAFASAVPVPVQSSPLSPP